MKSYLIYGLNANDIDKARRQVEEAMGMVMQRHESGYRGVYYRTGTSGDEHLVLQSNYSAEDGEWSEETHQDALFLLYLNETTRPDFFDKILRSKIDSLVLIKREML